MKQVNGPTNMILSEKLQKQLLKLQRKQNHVNFGLILDEVSNRIQTPKNKRVRPLCSE